MNSDTETHEAKISAPSQETAKAREHEFLWQGEKGPGRLYRKQNASQMIPAHLADIPTQISSSI